MDYRRIAWVADIAQIKGSSPGQSRCCRRYKVKQEGFLQRFRGIKVLYSLKYSNARLSVACLCLHPETYTEKQIQERELLDQNSSPKEFKVRPEFIFKRVHFKKNQSWIRIHFKRSPKLNQSSSARVYIQKSPILDQNPFSKEFIFKRVQRWTRIHFQKMD